MIRLLALAFLLIAAAAQAIPFSTQGSSGGSNPSTPQIVQYVHSAYQTNISTANNYKIALQPTQSGDTLVLGFLYQHGTTISSITNSDSSTWGSPACTADAGSGNYVTALYVFPNVAAGITSFTIAASANSFFPFQYAVLETNAIANSSPTNGSLCTASLTASSGLLSPGSFTPTTNNNANGGNLIFNYTTLCAGSQANNNVPTSWSPSGSFALLGSDISGVQGYPHASQWWTQATQASVSPNITAAGETGAGDCFNSATVALKVAAGSGTAISSSLNIAKILHQTQGFGGAFTYEVPFVGNLRILSTPWSIGNVATATVSSSDTCGGSSNFTSLGTTGSRIFYEQNCSPGTVTLTITTTGSTGQGSWRLYDVRNAQTSSFVNSMDQADGTTCSAGANNDLPTITPGVSSGLTIAVLGLGTGPGLGLASGAPSGAVFDMVTYTNETDIDNLENADEQGHVFFASNAAQNWNWNSFQGTDCYGIAAVFH